MNAKFLAPHQGANNPVSLGLLGTKRSSSKIHFRLWNINMGFDGLSWGDVTIPGLNIETFYEVMRCALFLTCSYCVFGLGCIIFDNSLRYHKLKFLFCSALLVFLLLYQNHHVPLELNGIELGGLYNWGIYNLQFTVH